MMRTLAGMNGLLVACALLLVPLPGSCLALRAEGEEDTSSSMLPALVYHGTPWLEWYLRRVAEAFPAITCLYSIGKSVENRELWVLAIGRSPADHVALRPDVKLVGNIHGNEVVSRELLIQLIHLLLHGYGRNATLTALLNSARVHVLVSFNPDGYARAVPGDCQGIAGRNNAQGIDLNRAFPDYFRVNPNPTTPESAALIGWMKRQQFTLSAGLHGGVLVANYPYDNHRIGTRPYTYHRSPDDDVFVHLARTYSHAHRGAMRVGRACGENDHQFNDGIVNGAAWYSVTGSMQDYNYIYAGCMEVTLEISCCKYPPEADLPQLWAANKDALVTFLLQVHRGVMGVVRNKDGEAIANASVHVVGRLHGTTTNQFGEFWRLLLPGSYQINVSAANYRSIIVGFSVGNTSNEQRHAANADEISSHSIARRTDERGVEILQIVLAPLRDGRSDWSSRSAQQTSLNPALLLGALLLCGLVELTQLAKSDSLTMLNLDTIMVWTA